jgi:hypothetical protein
MSPEELVKLLLHGVVISYHGMYNKDKVYYVRYIKNRKLLQFSEHVLFTEIIQEDPVPEDQLISFATAVRGDIRE